MFDHVATPYLEDDAHTVTLHKKVTANLREHRLWYRTPRLITGAFDGAV